MIVRTVIRLFKLLIIGVIANWMIRVLTGFDLGLSIRELVPTEVIMLFVIILMVISWASTRIEDYHKKELEFKREWFTKNK